MKRQFRLLLPAKITNDVSPKVHVCADDKTAMAELMLDAYRGTTDYNGEDLKDAAEEISNLIDGKYGTFLAEHSFLHWEHGILVSAALVTLPEDVPLLAFSMTRADFKRRGHAKAMIAASADSLAAAGYNSLDLWVTESNKPAVALYQTLGFKIV